MSEIAENKAGYTAESIQTLESLEHVRRRPGMYIGRLGNGDDPGDGIYVLLKETVDNSIDEFAAGFGKNIRITIVGRQVTVRDYGRGIPLEKVVDCTSMMNTSGKFDSKSYKRSVGLNGVGSKAVNALSSSYRAESYRNGECSYAEYAKGVLIDSGRMKTSEKDGTQVTFTPDEDLFNGFEFRMEIVTSMVKNYTYLNKGLTISLNGETHISREGLLDLINDKLSEPALYPPIHLEGPDLEVVITHGNGNGESIASFVNGQNTRDGGTHLAAFREAVAKTVREFFSNKDYTSEDVRQGIVGAISIKIQEPNFEGQTKTKLGSTYLWETMSKNEDGSASFDRGPTIRSFVNDFIKTNLDNYLHIHKETAALMQEKIAASEQERKEIAGIQKKSKERGKKTSVYNKKLKDCRIHYNDKLPASRQAEAELTSIFITEGLSASGTITLVRDAHTQAVFSLRGKPLNCYKGSRKQIAENEELHLLTAALGVEEDMDNLRYNNIIVATDADDDGMHIRMLVITFFMKYYPDLIRGGHVYILQTPLFRVKDKKKTVYCYSREEKEEALKKMKSGVQITRFKGLGEISSDEFRHFIGKDMRLDQVSIGEDESLADIMEFYMGDNTIDRQNFIRQNLRSEKELEDIEV